ncbi:uncharacterized protein [Miscanthus floridulus]|uniref:uncharacterized protein n=1 Tax=Miscanthus floridulus TaxID=154761 RepID=UPI0034573D1C
MLKGVSVIPPAVAEFSANNPPLVELGWNFVDPIPLDVLPTVAETGDKLAKTSTTSKSPRSTVLPRVSSGFVDPSAVPSSSEPQDSQHTIGEVVAGASELPDEVADLAAPEVTMAVASGPSEGLASASLEFDATHWLSKLTAAWGSLASSATSFGKKLHTFSHDHTGFFFSSKTEKKLSSKVSSLKTDLNLLQAELETERKSHQKEEKALRARVVEVEKQRDTAAQELEKQKDAAIWEASKNSEAMKSLEAVKKEYKALRVEGKKLSEGIDEMKALVHTSHNKAEEMTDNLGLSLFLGFRLISKSS